MREKIGEGNTGQGRGVKGSRERGEGRQIDFACHDKYEVLKSPNSRTCYHATFTRLAKYHPCTSTSQVNCRDTMMTQITYVRSSKHVSGEF